jgi:subtilisin family serine protease
MIRTSAWAAAAAAVLVLSVQPGLAQSQSDDAPITIHTQELGGRSAQESAVRLLRKAEERGEVRVIVGVDLTMRDEDELSASQQASQVRTLNAVQDAVARRSSVAGGRVTRFETIPFMSVYANAAQLQRLLNDPQVTSIQEDVPLQLHLQDSVPLIRAPNLWNQGFNGAGQTVAVLDTGADYAHTMFKGKVVAGFCRSTTQAGPPITTSTCPSGAASSNAKASGKPCFGHSTCDHGTHVSSIAIGKNPALKGVGREAKLISGKVFSLVKSSGGATTGTTAFFTDVTSGLERVYKLRNDFTIASINMSIGTNAVFNTACDDLLPAPAAIINKLFKAKIATVISSGNGFSNAGISAPSCIAKAIAVGSTEKNDTISAFSNHHQLVDVMAPGGLINAALPTTPVSSPVTTADQYGIKSGTSMAAPHVAGAIALLKDVRPAAGVKDILKSLQNSNVQVTRNGVTKRRIDMVKAKQKLEQLLP